MAAEVLEEKSINHILQAVTHLVKLPKTHLWLDYDAQADVLYLRFEDKPISTRSQMREDGIILDYKDDNLVAMTILEALQR